MRALAIQTSVVHDNLTCDVTTAQAALGRNADGISRSVGRPTAAIPPAVHSTPVHAECRGVVAPDNGDGQGGDVGKMQAGPPPSSSALGLAAVGSSQNPGITQQGHGVGSADVMHSGFSGRLGLSGRDSRRVP